jgi:regulator of replication initiation timing
LWAPLGLLRRLVLWSVAGLALYAVIVSIAVAKPAFLLSSACVPAAIYFALLGMFFITLKSQQTIRAQERLADISVAMGDCREELGTLRGENRVLDIRARLGERLTQARANSRLEAVVHNKERKIDQLIYNGKLSELKQRQETETLKRELEYYRKEAGRLTEENRWLKSALRQNHIDLAYLKDHVEQHVRKSRPSLLSRLKNIFSLANPSPGVVRLAQSLNEGPLLLQAAENPIA